MQERKAKNKITYRYHKRAMKAFSFRFHKVNDEAVIAKLRSVDNKNDYIRQLILSDIQKEEE